jgi:hypothetical protein
MKINKILININKILIEFQRGPNLSRQSHQTMTKILKEVY